MPEPWRIRTESRRIDMSQLAPLSFPILVGDDLARNRAWCAIRVGLPVPRHRPCLRRFEKSSLDVRFERRIVDIADQSAWPCGPHCPFYCIYAHLEHFLLLV